MPGQLLDRDTDGGDGEPGQAEDQRDDGGGTPAATRRPRRSRRPWRGTSLQAATVRPVGVHTVTVHPVAMPPGGPGGYGGPGPPWAGGARGGWFPPALAGRRWTSTPGTRPAWSPAPPG